MSTLLTDDTSAEPLRTSLSGKLFVEMRRAIARVTSGRARSAQADLTTLSDHVLKDIGLDRSEIASTLKDHALERGNGAWRQPW
jgi:uncharacterized protein YjiS (DUF1127 family)